jgi:prepilin-type N-terminal cleavage/methylation domain-containing protein
MLPLRPPVPHPESGFSLLELAIVLAIVGALIGGLLPILQPLADQQRRQTTREQLSLFRRALTGYVLAQGRLPCPADPSKPTSDANAGREERQPIASPPVAVNKDTAACVRNAGVLPWRTLAVTELDGWGQRFGYAVSPYFTLARNGEGGLSTFTLPIDFYQFVFVKDDPAAALAVDKAAAFVVSYGANHLGAWNSQGQQTPYASASAAELLNIHNTGAIGDTLPFFSAGMGGQADDLTDVIGLSEVFYILNRGGYLP